jgi:hypothetical protein
VCVHVFIIALNYNFKMAVRNGTEFYGTAYDITGHSIRSHMH